nr:hypothetical protein [uncultured Allomuricauda sp.]
MKIYISLIVLFLFFTSCVSIKSYQLGRNYSDDLNDPDRIELERKLDGLKEILNNNCTESKLVYVVSGQHLTIKMKNRCSKKLDSIIYYTLCTKFSDKGCGLLVKEHL